MDGTDNEYLKKIAGLLEELLEIEQSQIPIGQTLQLKISVSQKPTKINSVFILPNGQYFDPPYIKVDLFNDGPSPVYFAINSQQEQLVNVTFANATVGSINTNDMYVEDLKIPILNSLALFCATGKTASVRAFFKR